MKHPEEAYEGQKVLYKGEVWFIYTATDVDENDEVCVSLTDEREEKHIDSVPLSQLEETE